MLTFCHVSAATDARNFMVGNERRNAQQAAWAAWDAWKRDNPGETGEGMAVCAWPARVVFFAQGAVVRLAVPFSLPPMEPGLLRRRAGCAAAVTGGDDGGRRGGARKAASSRCVCLDVRAFGVCCSTALRTV
jgi:hypothetical protein